MLKTDFGLIFWVHVLVILAYVSAPLWLGWQWILIIVGLFYLQDKVFHNCVLTDAQLKGRDDVPEQERSFYTYYFQKMGLKINPIWVKKYFAYTLAWTVFGLAVIWQILLSQEPYLLDNILKFNL